MINRNQLRKIRVAAQWSGLASIVVAVAFFSGCDDSGTASFNPTPQTDPTACNYFGMQIRGDMGTHCCSGGQPLASPPADCPTVPGTGPVAEALRQVQRAGASGDNSAQHALALVGSGGHPLSGSGVQLAAGAGTTLGGQSSPSVSRNLTGSASTAGTNTNGSGTPSGAGGAAAGAGGNTNSMDQLRTSPASAGDGSSMADNGTTGGKGAGGDPAYANGGGGGYGNGGGAGMAGAGDDLSAMGARGEVQFGDGSGGAGLGDGKASGSDDPDNYFSLLGASENIFKIVERRYTRKATQWASTRAAEIRRAVPSAAAQAAAKAAIK